ncbi:MAG: T9SS type A sorting domain-containing protein [Bacteroidia bacterium]|nr:T9SS type A sorting domain-containing protein [Bacteroidia bacterium]NNC85500.1 T9SS type A sorting domain-containing protein [Bacteroidia bacterium]NNM16672.1 T9SS type A sorting domain-containing protein [Bacteroidia bacterium]
MKRLLLILALGLFFVPNTKATHLMGGEMTALHVGGDDFVIHLTAYRDTFGIPFALNANFDVYDSNDSLILSVMVPQDSVSGMLLAGVPYGVEVYSFTDTITVPGADEYRVEWRNCCRNGAITNLTSPLGESMSLNMVFTHFGAGTTNSTPVFLAPPVSHLPVQQPWQYNSLPFDVDGDSLVWTLDTPLTNIGVYAAGYTAPSDTAGPFTLDAATGQIDWTPDMLGNFVASIRVEEYRAGVKIGEIRRDYQMIVIPDTNSTPRIMNMGVFNTNSNGHAVATIPANSNFNVSLLAEDADSDPIEFFAYGEPFLLLNNAATFSTQVISGTKLLGTMDWTPSPSQARTQPYIVVFRTRDQLFSFDETVLFSVGAFTSIEDNSTSEIGNVFPNPTTNLVMVPISLERDAELVISLYTVLGTKVAELEKKNYAAGSHVEKLNLNVANGEYFITLVENGKTIATKKVIVNSNR